ncbi:hypothetical protein [Methanococcoides sp.]|jgi:predicted ABC-type ATPase|uniref:hypothetical protein n=1 Tax=Methanococcoides sp. TaxID=1966350 RepID=UPI00272EBAB7|nr:hypothetical protein [Methanococcoides sp.]
MKRIRIFAGANGAGKSTLINDLLETDGWLFDKDKHIEPDAFNKMDVIDFTPFGIVASESELKQHLLDSTLFEKSGLDLDDFKIENNCFINDINNDYVGSLIADYIRDKLIDTTDINLFSFETVFSHESKLDFMKRAKEKGWELYLYYVGTSDPLINQNRVKERVDKGQHGVSNDKIFERYDRTNDFLFDALKLCRRAFVFDNSNKEIVEVMQKDVENELHFGEEIMPDWITTYIISKIQKIELLLTKPEKAILDTLYDAPRPLSTSVIAKKSHLSWDNTKNHLNDLQTCRLIGSYKKGKGVYWYIFSK